MRPVALAAGVILAGCSVSNSLPSETQCDPLASHPTTLADVLGVGKDASGTLYVADQGGVASQPTVVRVFVVTSGSLVRQAVTGSGSANGEDLETFQSADGSRPPRDLTMVIAGGKATSMTLGPEGSGKAGIEGMDSGVTTPLTLVGASALQGMPAVDLPGAVSYVADGPNGGAIVVTEPSENDVGTAAFHLFYGKPGAMVERPIVAFEQALSGYPTIGFEVGSQRYVMSIASIPSDGGLLEDPGPVTLAMGTGGSVMFTLRLPAPKTLAGFTFSCLGS